MNLVFNSKHSFEFIFRTTANMRFSFWLKRACHKKKGGKQISRKMMVHNIVNQ